MRLLITSENKWFCRFPQECIFLLLCKSLPSKFPNLGWPWGPDKGSHLYLWGELSLFCAHKPFLSLIVQEFFPAALSHICYMCAAEQKFLVGTTSASLWISLWNLTNNHLWYL